MKFIQKFRRWEKFLDNGAVRLNLVLNDVPLMIFFSHVTEEYFSFVFLNFYALKYFRAIWICRKIKNLSSKSANDSTEIHGNKDKAIY